MTVPASLRLRSAHSTSRFRRRLLQFTNPTKPRSMLGSQPAHREGQLPLVRAGSAAEWQTVDNGGQERSLDVRQTRRSLHLQPPDLGRRRPVQWSSSLPNHACRERSGLLPARRWVTKDGPRPPVELGAVAACWERVVLAGRAARVPEAAVMSGNQRTLTVNRRESMSWAHAPDLGWGRRPKLHGMQGLRGSNPLSSTRHNASAALPLRVIARDLPESHYT